MIFEVTAGVKSVEADSALKRSIACVNSQVNIQVPSLCEEFATQMALELFHVPMSRNDMLLDIFFARQYFLTNWALTFLLRRMTVLLPFLLIVLYFFFLIKI